MNDTATATVNLEDLRSKVKAMYTEVAESPEGNFHFEMGRVLAERLGYPASELDHIPVESMESFAGVGFHLDLARIQSGDSVLDLGSGSGMDSFLAAIRTGTAGKVVGIDMTDSQLKKAQALQARHGFPQVSFRKSYLEELSVEDDSYDAAISNGVINLCPDKASVFKECHRVLKIGGRLAISDIVTEVQLPPNVVCNASLWAACIGGAMQMENYLQAITEAGFRMETVRENPEYRFLSKSAVGATRQYGVKSVSLLAVKV